MVATHEMRNRVVDRVLEIDTKLRLDVLCGRVKYEDRSERIIEDVQFRKFLNTFFFYTPPPWPFLGCQMVLMAVRRSF